MHTLSQPSARLFTSAHPAFKTKQKNVDNIHQMFLEMLCHSLLYQAQHWFQHNSCLSSWITDSFFLSGSMDEAHTCGTWSKRMNHSIPWAISTQGILFRVRGTDKGPFTLPMVRSMKGSGGTIKAMQRLICNTLIASHTLYTYTHKFSKNPEWKL